MAKRERKFPGDFSPEELELARLLEARFGWQMEACPSPDLLRAWSEEVLPEPAAQLVSKHVHSCSICAILKQDLAEIEPAAPTAEQLKRVREKIPARQSIFSGWFRPIPVFAAIAAAMLGIWIVRSWISHGGETNLVQNPPPAPRKPQTVEIAVSKAPIEIPPNLLLTYRGPARASLPSSEEWTNALAAYKEDNYAQAEQDLAQIERKYPQFADAFFYRGVSLLMLNRNEEAVVALQKVAELAQGNRSLETSFYLGAALARVGQIAAAREQWEKVCNAHQDLSSEACQDLPRLKVAQ